MNIDNMKIKYCTKYWNTLNQWNIMHWNLPFTCERFRIRPRDLTIRSGFRIVLGCGVFQDYSDSLAPVMNMTLSMNGYHVNYPCEVST